MIKLVFGFLLMLAVPGLMLVAMDLYYVLRHKRPSIAGAFDPVWMTVQIALLSAPRERASSPTTQAHD